MPLLRLFCRVLLILIGSLPSLNAAAPMTSPNLSKSLWSRDNLVAWCAVPFDANKRNPEDRAEMLQSLGFRKFAYDWREKDIPTFDAEIDALQKRKIDLLAWWFPFDAENPQARATLETFKRHGVQPQLWVMQSFAKRKIRPEKADVFSDSPSTPSAQAERVALEADRIFALHQLAAPYGCRIHLYNHNGWFGRLENELQIIEALKRRGVTDVGLVYNFSHARDEHHDDTTHFAGLWSAIKNFVVAVNISGTAMDGNLIYPSQGDCELAMMRTIEESGWRGPIGLIAEKGGDAAIVLKNYQIGLDWLAAELHQSGSGGPPPFPPVSRP